MTISLVIDASSETMQAGLWQAGEWLAFYESKEAPLESFFTAVDNLFTETAKDFKDIDRIVFCEGPGSILGMRIVAIALQAWRIFFKEAAISVVSYNAMEWAASVVKEKNPLNASFYTITPSRNLCWNVYDALQHKLMELSVQELKALQASQPESPFFLIKQRKTAINLPFAVIDFDYNLHNHPTSFLKIELFTPRQDLDAISVNSPVFQKWDGKRHH